MDVVVCIDGHRFPGLRLTPQGFTLCSITASREEEVEALQAFRAGLPQDLLRIVDDYDRLFQPPDAEPPEREVTHQIVLTPGVISHRRTPYPLSGTKLGYP